MKAADEDCELSELELTIMSLEAETNDLQSNSETPMDNPCDFYDDTLVAQKSPLCLYKPSDQSNPYECEPYSGDAICSIFDPTTSSGGTLRTGRKLPTPPQTPGPPAVERKDPLACQRGQNGNNNGNYQTCLKSYKEPPKRANSTRKDPKLTFDQQSASRSRCNWFLLLLIGILLSAAYVAATYYIVKTVSAEICGENVSDKTTTESLALLYGEVEFSSLNESWSSTTDFETTFVREMNRAVEDTVLSYYWKNATIIGFQPPISSWQKNTTTRIRCRFGLNLQLPPDRRRGIEMFAEYIIARRMAQLVRSEASVRCIVLLEPDETHEISRYECRDVSVNTSMSPSRRPIQN